MVSISQRSLKSSEKAKNERDGPIKHRSLKSKKRKSPKNFSKEKALKN